MTRKLAVVFILILIGFFCIAGGVEEINFLESNAQSTEPFELMKVISLSESIINSIEDKYENEWGGQEALIIESYKPSFMKIEESTPEIWETDRQFGKRKSEEKANLTDKMNGEIYEAFSMLESKKKEELLYYEEKLKEGEKNLSKLKTLESNIQVTPLDIPTK